jgi:ribosomal protein L5
MSLYKKFKETTAKELQQKLGKKNIHQVPQVDKIIVSMGI